MQRWKQWCRSQKQIIRKSESGITLVELLAVLALLSVVIVLAGSVHMFGQRQFRTQTNSASQNNDYSYAMTVMSTDLRKIPLSEVGSKITLNSDEYLIKINNGPEYEYSGSQLTRNDEVIVKNLGTKPIILFGHVGDEDTPIDRIEIYLQQTNSEAGMNDKNFHTTIYFRGEPSSGQENN